MRKILCGCLLVFTFSALAQTTPPGPWKPGAIDDGPLPTAFAGGTVLFSTFSGIAPQSFGVNSQVFTVSGGTTGIPAGYANTAADDFTIPASSGLWNIETVQVQGSYFNGAGPAQSVNVYILGNASGLPDTTNLSAGAIYAAENLSYTDAGTGDFEIDLPGGGLNLPPGTYWLVVQANMDAFSTGQWGWRESSANPDTGTIVGNESAWFESDTLFNACVGAWGARITTCNITQPPNGTANEFDLAFQLMGTDIAPDILVTPTAGLATNEGGASSQFDIVLTAPPTSTVTITIASNDVTEGAVSSSSAVFNSGNYNIPQTITITGQDDAVADGNVNYSILNGPVTSTDMRFSVIDPPDVSVINLDDEVAGISMSSLLVQVVENGPNMTFSVNTNTPPTADVMLPLTVTDTSEVTLSAQAMSGSSITITLPSGSTAPVTVTVIPLDDMIDDDLVTLQVGAGDPTSVGDAIYDALGAADVADVVVECDDDDAAGVTVVPSTPQPLQTDEAMTLNPTFSVVLDTEPVANVQVPLFSSDPSEGTLDSTTLLFTPANWNVPQIVTASGVNDDIDDGDVDYISVTEPANSTDPKYQGLDGNDISMRNLDDADTTGVTVTPSGVEPLITTEAGGTATFTVVLDSEPLFDVSFGISSDDTSEGTPDVASLLFTPMNWNVPQTVTVTGQDDAIVDGNIPYNAVTAPGVTNDPTYTGFDPANVSFENTDDEMAQIIVNPTSGLVTTEAGGTDTFTVVLTAEPTASVTVNLASDTPAEGTADTASVVFNNTNWDTPQTVTVTGVDDDIDDGDITYNIVLNPAVSADMAFSGINPDDVEVSNTDDDTAGISVSPTSGLQTSEDPSDPPATFDVVLDSEPTADVSIDVASDDATEGLTDVATLTFTAANWDTPQTVTVAGQDDLLFDGDIAYNVVTSAAVSTDPNYSGSNADDVGLTNLDNEFCGPVVITTQIGAPIIVQGTPGCLFDLYSEACGSDTSQWVLIASGLLIGPDGELTVPGILGIEDTCYVATVAGDPTQPLNSPVRTVPTLGTMALIGMCALLAAYGAFIMRRRRQTA